METALATVIVGVGTLGTFSLIAACINQTRASADLTVGMNLAANVRELSLSLAFKEPSASTEWGLNSGESATNPAGWDDINDLDGLEISPPRHLRPHTTHRHVHLEPARHRPLGRP